jgi:hypothetical protein
MADSIRKQITDAFVATLTTGTTGIVTVTDKKEPYWEWDIYKFPGVAVLENTERKSRFCFQGFSTSAGDMQGELEINIIGYAFDMNNDLDAKRTDLIKNIEISVAASTTLNDLTLDVTPTAVETDQGTLENFAIVHCRYMARYLYNHANP